MHWLEHLAGGGAALYDAPWSDARHKAAHVVVAAKSAGHYADYVGGAVRVPCRALAERIVNQGEPSTFRNGERRGERHAALGRGRLPCAKPVSDPLDRLAALAGVEPGYHDVAGVWHETPPETKRALLAAMRLDREAADVAIARLEALRHDEPAALRCVAPGSSDSTVAGA